MFKKFIYGLAALALLCSCDEDFKNWAEPQSNPAVESKLVNLVATPTATDIDIATVTGDSIQLVSLASTMPDGFLLDSVSATIVNEADGKKYSLPITKNGYVAKADIEDITKSIYGRRPTAREINGEAVIYAWTSAAKTSYVSSAPSKFKINVTPVAPVIESAYYYIGAANGWDTTDKTYELSNGGQDPYENPKFTVTVPAADGGEHWFKIAPASAYDRADFWKDGDIVGVPVNGQSDLTGTLAIGKNDAVACAWKIDQVVDPGIKYRITIDMLEGTYTIEPISFEPNVYFIGATDGWSTPDQKLALYDENIGEYRGFLYIADPNGWGLEFKFQREAGNWDTAIGQGALSNCTGDFEKGGDNIKATAGEGVYYVVLNLADMTLQGTKVNKMGIIGDFNGWGGDVEMTWNATDYCYEATGVGATASGWKFRINGGWDINLGGTTDNLTYNGDNIFLDASTIRLYPTRKTNANIFCTAE